MTLRIEESELARAPRLAAAVAEAERKGRVRRAPAPLPAAPRVNARSPRADLETALLTHLRRLAPSVPEPRRNYRFALVPSEVTRRSRRWELDLAWVEERVAVEVQGGNSVRMWKEGKPSHHMTPQGYENDVAKLNAAQAMGWVVLWVTGRTLARDPAGFVRMLVIVIARRRGGAK